MKKVFAIMMMAAALAACTREEQPQNETPDQPEVPTTYTLTVKASKGTGTRALELVGSTLKAYWDGNEKVTAHLNGEDVSMTIDLGGQSGQASCTLKGTFNQRPETGDALTLKLNKGEYKNQGGTLAYIGSNCDYAIANLTVSGVTDGKIEISDDATFVNQQAIVKFTLKEENGAAISPSALTVKGNGTEVATVTGIDANSDGVVFVAIPAISGTVSLTATTVDNDTYSYTKDGVTFTAGDFYSITVKMAKIIDLSKESIYVNGIFTAKDGDVLTGTFPTIDASKQIQIAKNATVTLNNVNIINRSTKTPGIALEGSATLILVGTNTVSANNIQAGISIGGTGTTLTITGNGSLRATGEGNGAGIGSSSNVSCGSIIINGGNIIAQGGSYAAGIGSGYASSGTVSCGNITINGGTVNATGGSGAAGIGTGSAQSGANVSCGSITISGGSVEVTSGNFAAGIGCGNANGGTVSCGDITISDPAQVTASRSYGAPYCIGPSTSGHCGKVTIYGQVHWDENEGIRDPNGYLARYSLAIP